jgi:hypothetical protein
VSKANWTSVTPTAFSWSGLFDGASSGATYGYASILPKTAGTFYSGLGSSNNTWAGPFQLILQNNAMAANYIKDQFIELSINLSKLGLDPVILNGGDICGTPFNRIVVKTRASASFTAELKDFVAPTDLFLAPRVQAVANIPIFCGTIGISDISVINPSPTSVYNWSTPNGHILGPTTGTTIRVDAPGDYIVIQRLSAGCNPYASDTVTIVFDSTCVILNNRTLSFAGHLTDRRVKLSWTTSQNSLIEYYEVERSADGYSFNTINTVSAIAGQLTASYLSYDDVSDVSLPPVVYYRLKLKFRNGSVGYSQVIAMTINQGASISISPNPVRNQMQVSVNANANDVLSLYIYDPLGKLVYRNKENLQAGKNILNIDDVGRWQNGLYMVTLVFNEKTFYKKVLLIK